MKICYLSDAGSVHTKKWCDFFIKQGHKVYLISLRDGNIDGVDTISLGFDDALLQSGSLTSKLKYLTKFFKVRKIIKKINPDIVHAHYATSYGMLTALSGIRPFYLSVWGSDVYDFPSNFITKSMLKYVLSCAKYIFSTSKAMVLQTSKFTNKPMEITPFGVDTNVFHPIEKSNSDDVKIIGCVKSLETYYGIHNLIKAFAEVYKSNKNIRLKIAGKGNQEEKLKSLAKKLGISECIEWLGFVSPAENVVKTFNSFDIAVVPSLAESFGVSAVEAQACGIPVIVSDVGGLPETVVDGKSGIIVPPDDIKSLSEAIKSLLNDDAKRAEMGKYGRELVCSEFDSNEIFKGIEKIYEKNLGRSEK